MNLYKFLGISSFFNIDNSMKKFNLIIFFSLIFMNTSCITKTDSFNRYVSKEKNIQFLVDQGRLYWDKRVNIKDANLAKLFLSKANDLNPDNAEIVELYAQACHFVGYYIESNSNKSDSLFIEGMKTTWSFIIGTNAFQEGAALFEGDSTGKKIAKTGIRIVPRPNPEKKVSNDANNANRATIINSILAFLFFGS